MCYEVKPENVDRVHEIVERFDLGCSVIGEVTDKTTHVSFRGRDSRRRRRLLPRRGRADERSRDRGTRGARDGPARRGPRGGLRRDRLGVRTPPQSGGSTGSTTTRSACGRSVGPGDDAAIIAVREAEQGLAISSGAAPNWTTVAPLRGARAVALENATNIAAKGATPLAAVDCLNGGNPGEAGRLRRLHRHRRRPRGDVRETLSTPVVGGNVSLYNDSVAGPIPPTPTLAMVGSKDGYDAPPLSVESGGDLVLVGDLGLERDESRLGGSGVPSRFDGSDRFPGLPADPASVVETLAAVANDDSTLAVHDVSHGGLAVALAEMVATTRASRCRSRRRIPLARCSTNSRAAR